jgi:Uma2 family endonuclease
MASAGRRKQMATALDSRHQTLVDFLAWERQQQARHERVNGVVRMITGGTVAHNRIARNCARPLDDRLQGSNCEVFASDMKIVSPEDDVMYPDAVIVCDDISERATELRTPVVVVELLSESTEARDHGPKRWAYQTIPSLQHYLLVDQGKPVVEVASRNDDGSWRSVIHRGLDARLRLDALGVEIGLDEVFARVTFAPASSDEAASASAPSG